jgi:hypothetical protein
MSTGKRTGAWIKIKLDLEQKSSSADIPSRKAPENILANGSSAFTKARSSNSLAESEPDLATSFSAISLLSWKKSGPKAVPPLTFPPPVAVVGTKD